MSTDFHWISCPACGSIWGPRRIGVVDVPEWRMRRNWMIRLPSNRLGIRKRTRDSTLFTCEECKIFFHSDGATRREVLGYNVSHMDDTPYDNSEVIP